MTGIAGESEVSCELTSLLTRACLSDMLHDMPTSSSHKSLSARLGRTRSERCLHLLDTENLLGTPTFGRCDIEALHVAYCSVVPVGPEDHVILASSHHSAIALVGWPGARQRWRSGPNGADLALIDVITGERVHDRFKHVVIGSGDGIFVPSAAMLQHAGTNVTIVSRLGSLARQLVVTTADIRYLPLATVIASGEQLARSA